MGAGWSWDVRSEFRRVEHDASAAAHKDHVSRLYPLQISLSQGAGGLLHIRCDPDGMRELCCGFEPSNAAHGGRRAKEDIMFKITRGELARKSNVQLSALFRLATERLSVDAEPKSETVEANALLGLIREELRRRFEP